MFNNYATNLTTTNLQNQISSCIAIESGYNILNLSTIISNKNKAYELTISAPINLMYGMYLKAGMDKYDAGEGLILYHV